MALPLIPIIMAVAGLASGVAKGISQAKNKSEEAKVAQAQAQQEINERIREATKLMSQQKNSFLKGGVYFEGTPEAIVDETYDFMKKDVNTMQKDANTQLKKLAREGRTAFATSVLEGIASGAMGFANAGGVIGGSAGGTNMAGNLLQKIKWGNLSNKGGFGSVGSDYNLMA